MRYNDEILNEVRENNDIVEVISQYVHLKRSGRNYFGLDRNIDEICNALVFVDALVMLCNTL